MMLRRRILLLGCIGIVAATAFGWYVPRAFWPIPGLVAEVKASLEAGGDDADVPDAQPDSSLYIQIDVRVIGFNTTRAETTLLADPNDARRICIGVVTDAPRLNAALDRLTDARCVRSRSSPRVLTTSELLAVAGYGDGAFVGVGADGSPKFRQFLFRVNAMPTVCKDGRIHVHLEAIELDRVEPVERRDGEVDPPIRVVNQHCTLVLRDGQTFFVSGHRRKQLLSEEFRVPLLSDLPIMGSSFSFPREAIIDEELLMLATVKRVAEPQ